MELKDYQLRTLDAFTRWLNELTAARLQAEEDVRYFESRGRLAPEGVGNYPRSAWQRLADIGEVAHPARSYVDRTADAEFPIPHVCLRVLKGADGRRQDTAGGCRT